MAIIQLILGRLDNFQKLFIICVETLNNHYI